MILIAVLVTLAVLFRPASALGLVLCNFGIQQWAQSQNAAFVNDTTLTNYFTAGLVVLALVVHYIRGKRPLANYPACGWLILLLLIYSIASVLWGVYPDGTIESWTKSWRTMLIFVALTPLLVTDEKDLRVGLLSTLLLGSVILALLTATSSWSGRGIGFSTVVWVNGKRVDAGNPLAIASMAGYVTLAGVLLNFSGVGRIWQLARWAVVAVALRVGIQSSSRGQVLAVLIVLLAFIPISRRIKSIRGFIGTVIGLGLVLGIAYAAYIMFADTHRFDTEQMLHDYAGGRLGPARTLLAAWASASPIHWLFGLGCSASDSPAILGWYPHFVPIEVLCEEGIVGFTAYAAALILATRAIFRVYRLVSDDPINRGVLATLGALFAYEVILSCKQGSMVGTAFFFPFTIMMGRLELAMRRYAEQQIEIEPPPSEPTDLDPYPPADLGSPELIA